MIIKKITFDLILPMWEEGLPNMSLEETSAMSCMPCRKLNDNNVFEEQDHYDLENQKFTPTFWGAFINDKLVGCNSGHMTLDRLYRSRGLYVKEEYRGLRIGQKLLLKTISQAHHEKAIGIWSYPRREAWMTYHSTGFVLRDYTFNFGWKLSESGHQENSRCIRPFDNEELKKLQTPTWSPKK